MRKIASFLIFCLLLGLMVGQAYAKDPPDERLVHTVKRGEILSLIANKTYHVSWRKMAEVNKLKNPDLIYPGQKLVVPEKFVYSGKEKPIPVLIPAGKKVKFQASKIEVKDLQSVSAQSNSFIFPPVHQHQIVQDNEDQYDKDYQNFALIAGAGWYEKAKKTAEKPGSHKGNYQWLKARGYLGWTSYNGVDYGGGIFGFLARGKGKDNGYKYDWWKWVVGPTVKMYGDHWDADIDVGLGMQYDKGGIDLYKSKQSTPIFLASAHLNMFNLFTDNSSEWFRKSELNLEYVKSFSEDQKHSWNGEALEADPTEIETVELALRQSIYDISLTDTLRVVPEINLALGENIATDQAYFKFGPSASLGWYGQDIFNLALFNYELALSDGGEDKWHPVAFYIDAGQAWRAYQAHQIREATDEDLVVN